MSARTILLALLALAVATTACQPPAQETAGLADEDVAAITAWNANYNERAGDWDAMPALLAEDLVLMPPDLPAEDWASWVEWAISMNLNVIDMRSTVQEIDGADGLAYLRATYSMTYTLGGNPEPIEEVGKHVAILRKQPDGSWLVTVWIWNSDLPLPEEGSETETETET